MKNLDNTKKWRRFFVFFVNFHGKKNFNTRISCCKIFLLKITYFLSDFLDNFSIFVESFYLFSVKLFYLFLFLLS